jgi:hypothetical protein
MATDSKRSPRPPVVSIVVLIFLLQVVTFAALLWLQLAGLGLRGIDSLSSDLAAAWLQGDRWIDAVLFGGLFLLSVTSVFVTIGLARVRPWAWLWAMTIQGVRLLIGLVAYFRGDPYTFSMLIPLIAVLLLDQVPVRRAFGEEGGQHG